MSEFVHYRSSCSPSLLRNGCRMQEPIVDFVLDTLVGNACRGGAFGIL